MKKLNLFIVCQLLCMLMSLSSFAQTNQTEEFISSMSFDEFVANLKKNIVIDKEDYNITIDYFDDKSKTIIISGTAKKLGGLVSETYDIINSQFKFQIELTQISANNWQLKKNKMIYSFKDSFGDPDGLSMNTISKMYDELTIITIKDNEFVVNDYFYDELDDLRTNIVDSKSKSEDVTLKKKERKVALNKYEKLKTEYNVYETISDNVKSVITRLMLYYF